MKKTFIALTCLCSIFLVACASKDIPQDSKTLEAPENEKTVPETEEQNIEDSQTQEESQENQTEEDDDVDLIYDEISLADQLPEPEELEEPVVITLSYEEVEETPPQEEDTSVKEEVLEEEIEPETIPEIAETEKTEENPQNIEEENKTVETAKADENITVQEDSDDDVIDVNDNSENDDVISLVDGEETSDEEEKTESVEEIIPSRKVTMKKMEYLDITYPGNGWIYMGLTDGSKDLSYFGRKLGTENTKFTLQARNAGTKIVHFYKNDTLTGQYIDDYIEIEILAQKGSNKTHIEAPAYKQPVPKKAKELIKKTEVLEEAEKEDEPEIEAEKKTEEVKKQVPSDASNEKPKTETVTSASVEKPAENQPKAETPATSIDTDILLQEAQVLYNEKEYKKALERINTFFEYATAKRDSGLYLKGQILEAKSEIQDIKAAIESYTTLTKNYPASKRWDDANKRIIYLKRFYLEVR